MKCRTKPSPRLKPSVRAKGKSKTERIIKINLLFLVRFGYADEDGSFRIRRTCHTFSATFIFIISAFQALDKGRGKNLFF